MSFVPQVPTTPRWPMFRPHLVHCRRTYLVAALAAAAASINCGDQTSLTSPTGGSVFLDIVSGNTQTGVVGKELPNPLVVQVMDGKKPVSGALVNFRVIAGGGTMYAGSALTNKEGKAQDYLTLGMSTAPSANVVEIRTVDAATGAKQVWGTFKATGTPVPIASVTVSPAAQSVVEGKMIYLTAMVKDVDGNALTDRVVTWTSSDETIAKVSDRDTGLVTGVKAGGPVTITATSEGKSGSAAVTVIQPPVARVEVSPPSASPHVGETLQLSATMRDADGNLLANRAVTWSSASNSTATVSATGLVTAVAIGGPVQVTATSEGVSASSSVTVADVPQVAVFVVKSGNGAGTVTSSPAGIDCGPICGVRYPFGSTVTLTATAGDGSMFAGWSGNYCVGMGPCTLSLKESPIVTATFNVIQEPLTVSLTGTGRGTVTSSPGSLMCQPQCTQSFDRGTEVTLSAKADAGSTFLGWSGACTGTAPCAVTMSAARSVTANFDQSFYDFTVIRAGTGGGMVTSPAGIDCGTRCTALFPYATQVPLTATADASSTFTGWSGACTGSSPTCNAVIGGTTTVQATFTLKPFTMTLSMVSVGVVSSSPSGISCPPNCGATFAGGTIVTLTATPGSGWAFTGWNGGGCSGTAPTCTIAPTGNVGVGATFAQVYLLTVSRPGTGSGTVTSPAGINCGSVCARQFVAGTSVVLTATPGPFTRFDGWLNAPGCGTGLTCTFVMTSPMNVAAIFTSLIEQPDVSRQEPRR